MRGSRALLNNAALRRAWARPTRCLARPTRCFATKEDPGATKGSGAKQDDSPPWRDGRVAAVCGSTLTMMTGHGVATPCIPLLATALCASAADVGAALSTFGLARLALNVPVGLAADSIGRKPLLVGDALVNAAGHAASALAPDVTSFAAARFVAGAGQAAYLGTAQVYLSDVAKPSQRGRVLGLNHAALLLGVSVGPVLGGFGAELSVRAPFYAVSGLGLLAAAHAFCSLEETKPATSPRKDEQKEAGRLRDVLADVPFASAAFAHGTTFAVRQGGRNLPLALTASSTFGYSPFQLGQLFGAMALADLAGVAPASWLSDKIADKRYVVCGSILGSAAGLLAVSWVAMAAEASGDPDQLAFLGAVSLWALSTAALGPTLPAYAAELVPEAKRGLGLAAFRSEGDVGFVGAPLALGLCADAFGAPAALAGLAGASVASAGAFAVLNRR